MGEEKKTTFEISISDNAKTHLNDIENYIALIKQQPINAVKVIDAIFAKLESIKLNPFSFKECEVMPTKTKMYRQVTCLSWIIVYSINKPKIKILGIIHIASKPSKIKTVTK